MDMEKIEREYWESIVKNYINNVEDLSEDERIVKATDKQVDEMAKRISDKIISDEEVWRVINESIEYYIYHDDYMLGENPDGDGGGNEDDDYPDDYELWRPGWCDTEKQVEKYISEALEELFHREVADCVYEFDCSKIYVSEIIWGEKK